MRTKSRARVAADRVKGVRARKDSPSSPTQIVTYHSAPISYRTYIHSPTGRTVPGPTTVIGDDMRRKFALRSQRDLELSKAYTEDEVNRILLKYGNL